jgi:hypothetical protein
MRLPRLAIDPHAEYAMAVTHQFALRHGELGKLLAYDQHRSPYPIDRIVPLGGDRWAVGRTRGSATVWRLADAAAVTACGHLGWLWTKDWWFDLRVDEDADGPPPKPLDLATCVRHTAKTIDEDQVHRVVASCVAALRRGKPVSVVLPPAVLDRSPTAARWIALTLLGCLPKAWQTRLRIEVGVAEADAHRADLAIGVGPFDGFQRVDLASEPPMDDLVAFFLLNRLECGRADEIESAAARFDGRVGDPWGEGIARHIRGGAPGLSTPTEEQLAAAPEQAAATVTARLLANAPLTPELTGDLIQVTLRTGASSPWEAMRQRGAGDRTRAVQAILQQRPRRPSAALALAILSAAPPDVPPDQRLDAITRWVSEGTPLDALVPAAQAVLASVSAPVSSTLVDAFLGWVTTLGRAGRGVLACEQLAGAFGIALARSGAAPELVTAWTNLPPSQRDASLLPSLLAVLRNAPEPKAPRRLLLERLAAPQDLAASLRWMPAEAVPAYAAALSLSADDPRWVDAEAELPFADTRERFLALQRLAPGLPALERSARTWVDALVDEVRQPDPAVAEVALQLAQLPQPSAVWPWLALVAAPEGQFSPPVVAAGLRAVAQAAPEDPAELRAAYALAQNHGAGGSDAALLEGISVLLTEPTEYGTALALAWVQGAGQAPATGVLRVAALTVALAHRGDEDVVFRAFLRWVLPHVWLVGMPRLYLEAVREASLSAGARRRWERAVRQR